MPRRCRDFARASRAAAFRLFAHERVDQARRAGRAAAAPPVPEPVATHRYEIDPEHEDVIGLIQVVKAGKGRHADRHRAPAGVDVRVGSGVLVYFMLYNIHR